MRILFLSRRDENTFVPGAQNTGSLNYPFSGTLQISGHDLGPCVEESWGDEDYEYWYSFDKANTEKLIAAIHGEEDPEAALIREFSGEEGCSRLESFCSEKKIKYRFSSYV